mgnify:FL=1
MALGRSSGAYFEKLRSAETRAGISICVEIKMMVTFSGHGGKEELNNNAGPE